MFRRAFIAEAAALRHSLLRACAARVVTRKEQWPWSRKYEGPAAAPSRTTGRRPAAAPSLQHLCPALVPAGWGRAAESKGSHRRAARADAAVLWRPARGLARQLLLPLLRRLVCTRRPAPARAGGGHPRSHEIEMSNEITRDHTRPNEITRWRCTTTGSRPRARVWSFRTGRKLGARRIARRLGTGLATLSFEQMQA